MASSNKTSNLELNIWSGSDIPKRIDFNADNQKIDSAITSHINNESIHLSVEDKMQCKVYYYTGTGTATKNVSLDFIPRGIIIYCLSRAPFLEDTANSKYKIYTAAAYQGLSGFGVDLTGSTVTVEQQVAASYPANKNLACLNENGMSYLLVAFRSSTD